MQLEAKRPKIRDVLHTAALALLIVPTAAKAQSDPGDRIDFTSLLYGEQGRTQVVEPLVRFTHFMDGGQSLFAELGVDVITGASPTGAVPSGQIQTHTSPSGRVITSPAGQIPTSPFSDRRFGLDLGWQKPWGRFVTSNLGGHFSREKDYQSLGINGKISTDVWRRLFTVTVGGGINRDTVFPIGGTVEGLSPGLVISHDKNRKNVSDVLFGVSHIMSRRWMLGVDASRTWENGYLTEPYKVLSVMNQSGVPVSQLNEARPSTRDRSSLLFSSVYHFTNDILYSSYRYYWDNWDLRSHTLDLKYRHPISDDTYIEPLFRYYTQSAASFYTAGLVQGAPLPQFASADYRLGDLQTITIGATIGYHPEESPGEWTLRAQYIQYAGNSSPPGAIGIQENFDLVPPVNTYAFSIGYSFNY
ncbi:MAG: DUF3570 domain-containing protein [Thermoanaerobaculia bacterium]